jgi:hypothetical protein
MEDGGRKPSHHSPQPPFFTATSLHSHLEGSLAMKRRSGKNDKKDKKRKNNTSGTAPAAAAAAAAATVAPALSVAAAALPVALTPPERKPVFFRRSSLPPGSVTYRMVPMTVLKEVLHVICPETCPGNLGRGFTTLAPNGQNI